MHLAPVLTSTHCQSARARGIGRAHSFRFPVSFFSLPFHSQPPTTHPGYPTSANKQNTNTLDIMTKGHSARKKNSAKQNVSIAHPDVFAKQDAPSSSSVTTTTTTSTTITTTSLKTSTSFGSLKQRSLVATLLNEGLKDLDHDLNEDHFGASQETSSQSNSRSKHPSQQSSSSTASSTLSSTGTINNHVSFWNWLTASRVASSLQLLQEQRDERYNYMEHRKRYASSKLSGGKQQEERGQSEDAESEKKLAKHTWDMAKVYRAYDLTGKDWVVLSALTILSLSVRMWHIDSPDQVM